MVVFKPYSESSISTKYGKFRIYIFREYKKGSGLYLEHVALVKGRLPRENALVRVHSECKTGDVFGSLRCDCGPQLNLSFKLINKRKQGIIIYLAQEGRGIGLGNKIKAYALQDQGYDTVEANTMLGFDADLRNFKIATDILKFFGVKSIELITNNPHKIKDLERNGIKVVKRVPCITRPNRFNASYIKTKAEKMGHAI